MWIASRANIFCRCWAQKQSEVHWHLEALQKAYAAVSADNEGWKLCPALSSEMKESRKQKTVKNCKYVFTYSLAHLFFSIVRYGTTQIVHRVTSIRFRMQHDVDRAVSLFYLCAILLAMTWVLLCKERLLQLRKSLLTLMPLWIPYHSPCTTIFSTTGNFFSCTLS